jgi:large subunit ribosomal protein L7e
MHGFPCLYLPSCFFCRNANAVVPESILKKRKAVEKLAALRIAHQKSQLKKNREQRKEIFKRAASYVQEYRQKEKDTVRMRREAKAAGNFFVPDESKLAFVIRIKG